MNKAFEKILERLEKVSYRIDDSATLSTRDVINKEDAKEIVQEVAEEYNDGWIPCSERLPEELQKVLIITDKQCYYIGMINTKGKWVCIAELVKTKIEMSNVIAWQPLPEPYQPKVCNTSDCPYNTGRDCPAADGCAGYEQKGE